jgi:hypothetical protein
MALVCAKEMCFLRYSSEYDAPRYIQMPHIGCERTFRQLHNLTYATGILVAQPLP